MALSYCSGDCVRVRERQKKNRRILCQNIIDSGCFSCFLFFSFLIAFRHFVPDRSCLSFTSFGWPHRHQALVCTYARATDNFQTSGSDSAFQFWEKKKIKTRAHRASEHTQTQTQSDWHKNENIKINSRSTNTLTCQGIGEMILI